MKKIFLFAIITLVSLSCYSYADFPDPVASCAGVTDIPEIECQGLLSFYNAMDGDNWTDKSNWGDTGNVASWYGLTLSAGHVTEIQLISNNLSGSLSSNILGGVTFLQTLFLNNNQITRVESGTFNLLSSLQTIYLNNNQITTIDTGAFLGLSNLFNLYLNYNQLTAINSGRFTDLSSLINLELAGNQISRLESSNFSGLNSLTYMGFGGNQITIIESGAFNELSSLTDLNLNYNQLSTLDNGIFIGLGSLTNLNLYGNQINSIASGGFIDLSLLTTLNLEYNQIASITNGMFAGLNALTYLPLNGNQITTIHSGGFNGLSSLTQLDLNSNQISTIHSGAFNGLTALQYLTLTDNQMTGISNGIFIGLTALEGMYLQNNQITSIDSGAWSGLDSLTQLYLSSNQMTGIYSGEFLGLNMLTDLGLNSNQISTIDSWGFNGLNALTNLIIINNQISTISNDAFNGMHSLQGLNLSNNQISAIGAGAFNGMGSLQSLSLNNNQISTIDTIDFNGLSSLKYLTLNYNQITEINSGDFDGLSSLEHLDLSNNQITSLGNSDRGMVNSLLGLTMNANQITEINSGDFDGLSSLEYIYLDDNNIATIHSGDFDGLTGVTVLSLNNNQITSIEYNDFIGTSIRYLHMQDNKITSIDSGDFIGLNLIYIYLDNNQITKVDAGALSGNTLNIISLSNNYISTIESGVFATLPNLNNFSLYNNCLDEFALDPALVIALGTTYNFSDRSSQQVCPSISYNPASTGAGPVTGTIVFTGGLAVNRNSLYTNNPILPYYVRLGNYDHLFDLSSLSDVNLLRYTNFTGSVTWMIDTIAPTADVEYSPASGSWTSGDVLVTFTGESEPLTGFDSTGYLFTGNGTHDVVFGDAAGNTGSITATVSWIDRIAPAVQSVILSGGVQATEPITIAREVTDDNAVSSVQVMVADDTGAMNILSSGDVVFADIPLATGYIQPAGLGNGHYYYYLIIHDAAGNETTSPIYDFNYIDTAAPTASVDYDVSSRTNGDVIATLVGESEPLTGLNVTSYTFTGNGSFVFTFEDMAGNTGSATATVTRIDKESPTFTGIVDNGIYSGNVIINMTDNNTGVSATIDSSIYTGTQIYTNGNVLTDYGTYTLTITDLAGNTTGATFIISRYMVVGDTCFEELIINTTGVYTDDLNWLGIQNGDPDFQTFITNAIGYTGGANRGGRFLNRWNTNNPSDPFIDWYVDNVFSVRYGTNDISSVHTSCGLGSNTGNNNTGSQNIVTPPSGGGGPGSLRRDICLGGDHSDSYYDGLCTASTTGSRDNLGSNNTGSINISGTTISSDIDEITQAYHYAFTKGITTQKTKYRARLSDPLTRAELAKMISVYVMQTTDQKPNTSLTCTFPDIADQSAEMKGYIKTACQLGLMGIGMENFHPNDTVDKGTFATVFSRVLRGSQYNGGTPFYSKHLTALKDAKIMNNITNPLIDQLRGNVMIMMMRADINK